LIPPPLSAGEPAFDAEDLLVRVDGDRALLVELVGLLRGESPRLLSDLRRSLAANDGRGLQRAAHALRGSVGNFAARPAARLALELEAMAREGELAGGAARLAELEREVGRLERDLARLCEEPAG